MGDGRWAMGLMPKGHGAISVRGCVNLIEVAALGEMRLLGRTPAARHLVDRDPLSRAELLGIFGRHLGVARAVVMPGSDFLALRGVKIYQSITLARVLP